MIQHKPWVVFIEALSFHHKIFFGSVILEFAAVNVREPFQQMLETDLRIRNLLGNQLIELLWERKDNEISKSITSKLSSPIRGSSCSQCILTRSSSASPLSSIYWTILVPSLAGTPRTHRNIPVVYQPICWKCVPGTGTFALQCPFPIHILATTRPFSSIRMPSPMSSKDFGHS
jgi:hypothetical protein